MNVCANDMRIMKMQLNGPDLIVLSKQNQFVYCVGNVLRQWQHAQLPLFIHRLPFKLKL